MGFLSGSVTFECFRVRGSDCRQFGPKHIQTLKRFAVDQIDASSAEQPVVGFLGGEHLFDRSFDLEKNVIADALHCAVRIDTNQIPGAVRRAWLQMELAAATADSGRARPTKAQRQQAKEAVEARCQQEIREGKYRRMQQFPLVWDLKNDVLFFGGASSGAAELCRDLWSRAFGVELERMTAGHRALAWAAEAKQRKTLEEIRPASFLHPGGSAEIAWWNGAPGNFDFLGNEFLLWLWWRWETLSDTIKLPDGSEVTGMFARTLALQCPRDESGKETITAENPTRLPEAAQAVRSGKLPRKAGCILVRYGEQYELVLQAETFVVSGAKIRTEDRSEGRGILEDRLESVRGLHETIDLLFRAFCARRVGNAWTSEVEKMRHWLKNPPAGPINQRRTGR